MDHVNLRELVNISFVPPRHPRGTGFIGWDLVNSCDLAHAANSTLRSKHAHARFLLDWGGAQIGNKIEGNTESSNSAIQFSVFVFGIVRRIRRSRGRHLEHLRATLRARALVFQPSAGIEYSKLLFPILRHGIATLIFNLWSSYRSIDKKKMRYKALAIPGKFKPLAGYVHSSMFVDMQPGGAHIFIDGEAMRAPV